MTDETQDEQQPDLRGEQSREPEAAKEGVVARELDPEVEVGDPDTPDPSEPGDEDDDDDTDGDDDAEPIEDI